MTTVKRNKLLNQKQRGSLFLCDSAFIFYSMILNH